MPIGNYSTVSNSMNYKFKIIGSWLLHVKVENVENYYGWVCTQREGYRFLKFLQFSKSSQLWSREHSGMLEGKLKSSTSLRVSGSVPGFLPPCCRSSPFQS